MSSGQQIAGHDMPIATVKQLCKPSPIVTSDSLVEQVAQLENFRELAKTGSEFFKRNHFTDGLKRLVERGFERLAGRSDKGSFYLTQSMGAAQHTRRIPAMRFSTSPPKSRFRLAPLGLIEGPTSAHRPRPICRTITREGQNEKPLKAKKQLWSDADPRSQAP
jgi:hypothetical protein